MSKNSSNSTTTSITQMKPASMSNPFFTTKTDKDGNTVSNFTNGSAGQTAYNFVNNNISSLLDQYLNPTLNSTTNKAKLNAFNKQQQSNLQNNIINPLARNNMIRSSQATNMYNNLSNQAADYANELLANSQNDTANMINTLMNMYTNAYNGIASEQDTNINTALGSGTTTSTSKA